MPQPTSSLATLRPDLGGSVMEFDLAMDRLGFIGLRVMPVVEVAKQAGVFGRIPLAQLLQNKSSKRAPRSGYQRGHWTFESDSYACEEHGWEEPVDDREARMYADYFDAELVAAARARDFVLRQFERNAASTIFNAVTWSATAVTNEWDDAANATPIADVNAAALRMYEACGLWPNALVINRKVFRNLRLVDEITDKIQYVQGVLPRDINVGHLQAAFDLPNILVAGSVQNTANEGAAASLSPIWSDEYAAVCRIAESSDIQEPCVGRTFHWGEDGSTIGSTMETYRDETVRADIVRARMDVDHKVIYTAAQELLSNITT